LSRTSQQLQSALARRYLIERELGRGGMATVYLAYDPRHNRKVAVKVLRPELAGVLGTERFLSEIQLAAGLSHPHILPVHDSGEVDGVLYYITPYVEGDSLGDLLGRGEQLPAERAVQLALEAAEALEFAHERGVIHCDIKPGNILLQAGRALVADFGIARAIGTGVTAARNEVGAGTPEYMSPEQAFGEDRVDGRTDVYSLGCVLYELLAGRPPFTGKSVAAILSDVLTKAPPALDTVTTSVPPALAAAVARAMAREPDNRFQSANEFTVALQEVLSILRGEAAAVRAAGPPPARVAAVFGVAAAATLAGIYGLLRQMQLPNWTFALAAALLAIGVPVLFLTGRQQQLAASGVARTGVWRWFTWRNAVAGGVLALMMWAIIATALLVRGTGGSPVGEVRRIAVLPFENLGAREDSYFADGIADEIRSRLRLIPRFRVLARESMGEYENSGRPLQEIGKELSADYLLTARVRRAGGVTPNNRVQVSAELIEVSAGEIAWGESFDAAITDVFQVQADIAVRVASALRIALDSADQRSVAAQPTGDIAAYEIYLRAKEAHSHSGDAESLQDAVNLYSEAVAIDSTFVDAWAGLSDAAARLYIATADSTVGAQSLAAALQALALDTAGVSGQIALANYYAEVEGDPVRSLEEARIGLRSSPNDAHLLTHAAWAEQQLGLWQEALAHLTEAQALSPRSAETAHALGFLLLRLRRYAKAHDAYETSLRLDPDNLTYIIHKGLVHLAQGDLNIARGEIKAAARSVGTTELALYLAAYHDLYWILDDVEQEVVLRLPPSAYLRGRVEWSLVRMQLHAFRGDSLSTRAYADSARVALENRIRSDPSDPVSHASLGLALAHLEQREHAISEGQRAVALLPLNKDALGNPYLQHQLARIYLLLGEHEDALDVLEQLLDVPYLLSPGWLRIDPTFDPLRGNPRFESLASSG